MAAQTRLSDDADSCPLSKSTPQSVHSAAKYRRSSPALLYQEPSALEIPGFERCRDGRLEPASDYASCVNS